MGVVKGRKNLNVLRRDNSEPSNNHLEGSYESFLKIESSYILENTYELCCNCFLNYSANGFSVKL